MLGRRVCERHDVNSLADLEIFVCASTKGFGLNL